MPKLRTIALRGYEHIARNLSSRSGSYDLTTKVLYHGFADGESRMSLPPLGEPDIGLTELTSMNPDHMTVIAGTHDDRATLDLFDLLFGLRGHGINSVTLVVPYFGYARQDKRGADGRDVKKAKSRVDLLAAGLLEYTGVAQVILVDPHVPNLEDYFPSKIRCKTISLSAIWVQLLHELRRSAPAKIDLSTFCIGSVDFGRTKEHEIVSTKLGVSQLLLQKDRSLDNVTIVEGFGQWTEEMGSLVIIDDMISTGSSALKAAQYYKSKANGSPRDIYIFATHGIFCADAINTLRSEPTIKGVVTTDTHPQALVEQAKHPDFVTVYPIDGFLESILR